MRSAACSADPGGCDRSPRGSQCLHTARDVSEETRHVRSGLVCARDVLLLPLLGACMLRVTVGLEAHSNFSENCALLGCYAASGGNSLPTFLDNLSVPSTDP